MTPKPAAGLPTEVVNDKGRYRQHPITPFDRVTFVSELLTRKVNIGLNVEAHVGTERSAII